MLILTLAAAPAVRGSPSLALCTSVGNGSTPCTFAVKADHRADGSRIGCISPFASNYDPMARVDSGHCEYATNGCTDARALNFNPMASRGSEMPCILPQPGCMMHAAFNYDSRATVHTRALCMLPQRATTPPGSRGCTP